MHGSRSSYDSKSIMAVSESSISNKSELLGQTTPRVFLRYIMDGGQMDKIPECPLEETGILKTT